MISECFILEKRSHNSSPNAFTYQFGYAKIALKGMTKHLSHLVAHISAILHEVWVLGLIPPQIWPLRELVGQRTQLTTLRIHDTSLHSP